MRELRYLDVTRLAATLGHLGVKPSREWAVSAKPPMLPLGASWSRRKEPVRAAFADIAILEDLLRANDLLTSVRPGYTGGHYDGPPYVLEEMTATRMSFPDEVTAAAGVRPGFAVWVSGPKQSDISLWTDDREPWDLVAGAWLFLTEYSDEFAARRMLSGCSALQAVWNIATDRDLVARSHLPEFEPLGRGRDHLSVEEKLIAVGAVRSGTRRIRSLYSTRYVSNEQETTIDSRHIRIADVLGYPLYVEALSDTH